MMRVDIITLFPDMFVGPFDESIVGRARERSLLHLGICDLRDFTTDKHRTADDYPYGGGQGMVMKPEPLVAAIEDIRAKSPHARVILLSPQGPVFNQRHAARLAQEKELVLICGRYEGVDER